MSKKSEEFDEKEKKLERGPLDFLKEAMPFINSIVNKPPMVEVKLNIQGWQLRQLSELIETWDKLHNQLGCCNMEPKKK